MNVCTFTGRLGQEPRSVGSVCHLNLAVSRKVKGEDQTMWVDVAVFGQQAERAVQYLHKGSLVGVTGEAWLNTFTGRDGNERTSLQLNCNAWSFLESAKSGNGNNGGFSRRTAEPSEKPMEDLPF